MCLTVSALFQGTAALMFWFFGSAYAQLTPVTGATAKANFRKKSCLLCSGKRTFVSAIAHDKGPIADMRTDTALSSSLHTIGSVPKNDAPEADHGDSEVNGADDEHG